MNKVFNYIIKNKKFKLTDINKELSKQLSPIISKSSRGDIDTILENLIIKTINQKCEDLNYLKSCTHSDNLNNIRIKILGDNNLLYDNSIWVELKTNGLLDKTLNLKKDLLFSESEIFTLLLEFTNTLSITENNKLAKEQENMLFSIAFSEELKEVKDLEKTVNEIFLPNENNLL